MSKKQPLNLNQFFKKEPAPPASSDADMDFLYVGEPENPAQLAQELGLPMLHLPPERVAPDPQQLRRLLHPDELQRQARAGDKAAAELLAGLQMLGQSMVDHGQLQPVVVYPDSDPANPAITHRLLNGQRRWSAALLAGLPSLWAVEVPRPSEVQRLVRQFEENERRQDFCDMERAWALHQMKTALQAEHGADVAWHSVEAKLQISEQRRQDLLRLLRFSRQGQELILRHGWSEWTLRPLHMALSAGSLAKEEADDILRALAEGGQVSATLVAQMVEGYRRELAATSTAERGAAQPPSSSQASQEVDITRRLARLRKAVSQLRHQLSALPNPHARQTWRQEIEQLRATLDALLAELEESSPVKK